MACVWAARQHGKHGFEKLVAVKTILPEYARNSRFRSMFLDEAQIASRVDHPNVARILDVGEEDDLLYLVMEWVDGDSLGSLHHRLREAGRTIPAGIALRILGDLCGGLHVVHEVRDDSGAPLSVVHRDVSPENILIDPHGNAKLVDFGVAKARDRLAEETMVGMLKGKLHYMAPEQAAFRPVDRRTDVWAVGAILYRLFAGFPPYKAESREGTLALLNSGQKPPPLPATVPRVVSAIAERALMHEPDERFATAAELKAALEAALVTIHARTTTEQVADFVTTHMADRIEARRVVMAQARRRTSGRSPAAEADRETMPDMHRSELPTCDESEVEEEQEDDTTTSVLVEWPKLPTEQDGLALAIASVLPAPNKALESHFAGRPSHSLWRAWLAVVFVAAGALAAFIGRRRASPALDRDSVVAPLAAPATQAQPSASVEVPKLTAEAKRAPAISSAAAPASRVHPSPPPPPPRPRHVARTLHPAGGGAPDATTNADAPPPSRPATAGNPTTSTSPTASPATSAPVIDDGF
jgi:serine/threonine-protein kinase